MRPFLNFFNASFVLSVLIDKLVGEENDVENSRASLIEENRIAMQKLFNGRSGIYNPGGIFDIEEDDIKFSYYNQESNENGMIFDRKNMSSALKPSWKKGMPLKILTHGWMSSEYSDAVAHIRQEYLKSENLNIVTVDWSKLAMNIMYPIAAIQTYQVGGKIGEMVDEMVKRRMVSSDQIHIIGHSLGAHVAGAAGGATKTGKVYRVTGLDPALPGFELLQGEKTRLDATDAEFVDVIHTAAGTAGYYSSCGHADFYPNGGTPPQPGCLDAPLDFQSTFGCSHFRAHEYYTQSISNQSKFMAHQADSYRAYNKGNYNKSDFSYMGHNTLLSARGDYYLRT